MKIKKNIKLSKRLLFTSLAAVALLGATQPVLASSMNPYEGHSWFRQDSEMIDGSHWGEEKSETINSVDYDHGRENVEDTSHDKAREYEAGREDGYREGLLGGLFPDTTGWPTEYKEGYLDGYGRGINKHNNQGNGESSQKPKLPPLPDYPWPESPLKPKKPSISDAPELDDDYQRGFKDGRDAHSSKWKLDFSRFNGPKYSDKYKQGYKDGYLSGFSMAR